MIRSKWKAGPVCPAAQTVVVSATQFLYRRWHYLLMVGFHGGRLRRAWGSRRGSIGLFTGVELARPLTYSLSVWRSYDDLAEFMRAPEHAKLMRDFRDRLENSTSVIWEMDDFTPDAAWHEGLRRPSEQGAGDHRASAARQPG